MVILTHTETNVHTIETINVDDAMPCHAMHNRHCRSPPNWSLVIVVGQYYKKKRFTT